MDFLNHRFLVNKENIVFLGSSGVGKTHLATSIGISVAKKKNVDILYQVQRSYHAAQEGKIGEQIRYTIKTFCELQPADH